MVDRNQHDIEKSPNAEASEAEQLADALLPVTQVEAVGPEAAQREAQHQGCAPAGASGPVAGDPLGEVSPPQADDVR